MIRLVGIDVDGTLVGSSGVVAPEIWRAAERARDAGVRLALCSGRPAFGVAREYAERLDADGWHVFQNGASIVHLSSNGSRSVSLRQEAVAALIEHARRIDRVLELYSDDDYVAESTARWAYDHADLLGVPFEPRAFEVLRGPVVRAQWLLPPEEVSPIVADAPPGLEIAQSSSPLMPGTVFVGLTHEGVSKAAGVRAVAAEYGVPLEHVMYVGDSGNDLSALEIVGCPVAMANSTPAVLGAAKHVVGRVDDAGLAEALELARAKAQ